MITKGPLFFFNLKIIIQEAVKHNMFAFRAKLKKKHRKDHIKGYDSESKGKDLGSPSGRLERV